MSDQAQQSRRRAEAAADSLSSAKDRPDDACAVVGFDGFVDTIVRMVRSRGGSGYDDYEPMERMEELARRIEQAAGRSANLELAVQRVKAGGNGVLMASGLAALGAPVTYFGNLGGSQGSKSLHPVFESFAGACRRVYNLGPAGFTDAVEFNDGKLMLGKLESLEGVTWEAALEAAGGVESMRELVSKARIIATGNWTMLEGMDEIWRGLTEDVLAKLDDGPEARHVFVDLADPAKRSDADLEAAAARLGAMNTRARVTLGLNMAESVRMAKIVGAERHEGDEPDDAALETSAASLREKIRLRAVVIHHQRGASAAEDDGSASMLGPYTRNPKLSTGAGDHFNAGFTFSAAHGLPLEERLAAAVGVSGFYVRRGEAPKLDELIEFLRDLPSPD
ncbi:MAG: carbohydrate kinase family protein [Phycisphaeraceae bacterium]|nr:MAG: carbohydrate kinase family protein [Phycisphaeraceae bacterium]